MSLRGKTLQPVVMGFPIILIPPSPIKDSPGSDSVCSIGFASTARYLLYNLIL